MDVPAIDRATFDALKAATGADFVPELIDTFLDDAPRMLADLRAALAARDAEKFRRTAHSLKSNGNTFGALTLGAMARTLELEGMAKADEPASSLAALDREYARVTAALALLRDA